MCLLISLLVNQEVCKMKPHPFTVTTLLHDALPGVVALIQAQEERLCACDPLLRPPRSHEHITQMLIRQWPSQPAPFVIWDAAQRVRGYAAPAVWDIGGQSVLHAFLTARNGIAQSLTLPDPRDEDAAEVVETILRLLPASWRQQQTTGELIRWPSCDSWLAPFLLQQGFLLDSICALHPGETFQRPQSPLPSWLHLRLARPEDEERLVDLFREELQYHEQRVSFARSSPVAIQAFQAKLARLWQGAAPLLEAPLVLVVQDEQEVVAMLESTLLEVSWEDEPGWTPPGSYVCIDNMSVSERLHGQGIGSFLLQALSATIKAIKPELDGYVLWYNPENAAAARFWSHRGFHPLWNTYQRRRSL